MPHRHTPAYPAEFRERLVELVRSGRSPEDLAREFEPSAQTIRNWVARAERDTGKRSDGLTTAECAELRRLRASETLWALPGYRRLWRERGSRDMFNFDLNYSIGLNSVTTTSYRTGYHMLQLNLAYLF